MIKSSIYKQHKQNNRSNNQQQRHILEQHIHRHRHKQETQYKQYIEETLNINNETNQNKPETETIINNTKHTQHMTDTIHPHT